ncbi:MAG: ABC transporter substrate-binding protein, partial [Planctomycetales bacterium]
MDWGHLAKRLSLGVGAIALASAVLLLSDLKSRRGSEAAGASGEDRKFRVAILVHASQPILEDGERGVIDGLAESGYINDQNMIVTRFNAQGDLANSNAIALQIVNDKYDLAVTLSTPSLQSLANANKFGKVRHVFGMVTDPIAAGVGIKGTKPDQHPPHLVGLGTLQPVAESIDMARKFYPGLKTLGVVWNPAEINSQVTTKMCRDACAKLGIELKEVNAENTAAVREATAAVISQGVDAIWVGGDVTVLGAVDSLIALAKSSKIPVFTVIPGNADRGALFDLGANYYEVGKQVGELGGRILPLDTPISKIPVELYVPPKLCVNTLALHGLKAPWKAPADILAAADQVTDEKGTRKKPEP